MKKILLAIFLAAGFVALPQYADAALLYTGAANQVAYVGESFVVEWYLDTQGKSINSMSLTLTFASDKLEVLDASTGNSALDLWIKTPQFDNQQGTINLVGGVSGGLNDSKVPVFRATFKPKATGEAKISLDAGSQVLLADGLGSGAGVVFNEINFRINPLDARPSQITSSTHAGTDTWYKAQDAEFLVQAKPGEEYSYSFSSNLEIFPDAIPDDINTPINFKDLDDGIYYFKLNSRLGPSDWQEAGVYRVQVDTTPPREFTPSIGRDPAVFDGAPFVTFSTSDNISGVSHYEVKTSFLSGWQRVDGTYYKLPGLVLGETIEVKAVDAAGNERVASVKVDKNMISPFYTNPIFWVIIILSILGVILLVWLYLRALRKYKINDK